ncbi:MAG: exodeoxyribonuclease VII large subunit [Tissierellia bacterium]|nr:exodeoxyribonuclease VII large subunit [Tissierellia bacterium]
MNLSNIKLEGEVCAFRSPSKSGHLYFELKDQKARIQCVFYHILKKYGEIPFEEGDHISVEGSIDVYEKSGQYQFRVRSVEVEGVGSLYKKFLLTKRLLEEEGLFSVCQRPLPKYPETIGIITSPTGAALQDVLSVIKRRYPRVHIRLYPVRVQGVEAIVDIINALDYFNSQTDIDLVLLTRGGGSYEELAIFNDESLAREIVKSKHPVVSAIGHETDFLISDFVSDLRAATPTAAAELITPDVSFLLDELQSIQKQIVQQMDSLLSRNQQFLLRYQHVLQLTSPLEKIKREHKDLYRQKEKMTYFLKMMIEKEKMQIETQKRKILLYDYDKILEKGFTLTKSMTGKIITRRQDIKDTEAIITKFYDGEVASIIER